MEAFHTLNNNTYSCKIPNVVPSDINVNLSEGLWQQVMDSLPSLNSFQTEASFFWDLLTTYPSFQGYSVADIQANLQQFKNLSAQNHANELEVLARMIVFKEVMQSYGYNSLEISTNLVSATTDFLTGIFSEVFSKEKLNLDAYASTLVSDAKKEIFKLAIEQAVEISDPVISKLCSHGINGQSLVHCQRNRIAIRKVTIVSCCNNILLKAIRSNTSCTCVTRSNWCA